MSEQLQQIGFYDELVPGDRVKIVIKPRGWLGETIGTYLTAARISRVQEDPRFNLLNWTYNDDGSVTLNIEIVEVDPFSTYYQAGVSPWIIALAIVGASIAFISVTTYKVVSVIGDEDNPNAQRLSSGIQIFAIALLIFAVYLWRK